MHMWITNACAWIFKWFFLKSTLVLIGKREIKSVNILVTYGESQDFGKVETAMRKYMPSTMRLRCNFHISSKGWEIYVSNKIGFNKGHK